MSHGGPVIEISDSEIPSERRGCSRCASVRKLFEDKIAKLTGSFNSLLMVNEEIRKMAHAFHTDLMGKAASIDSHASDCVVIVKDGDLGDPDPWPPGLMPGIEPDKCDSCGGSGKWPLSNGQIKDCPDCGGDGIPTSSESLFSKNIPYAEPAVLTLDLLEKSFQKAIEPAPQKIKIIKVKDVVCPDCMGSGCDACNSSGMVSAKKAKKEKSVAICGWCVGQGMAYGKQCPKCSGTGFKMT